MRFARRANRSRQSACRCRTSSASVSRSCSSATTQRASPFASIVTTTRLGPDYGYSDLAKRLGELGTDWLLLGGVSPSGAFRLWSDEQRFKLEAGWTVIHFAPEQPAPGDQEAAAATAPATDAVAAPATAAVPPIGT